MRLSYCYLRIVRISQIAAALEVILQGGTYPTKGYTSSTVRQAITDSEQIRMTHASAGVTTASTSRDMRDRGQQVHRDILEAVLGDNPQATPIVNRLKAILLVGTIQLNQRKATWSQGARAS
uniref:Uncharacterized protein n=1 Tax=Arundo donax TaxID=35708 RepID=A0A0A8Z8F3_ARUDO